MLIGIVSDTHGHVEFTQQAVRMLESLEVELVIHCGDIGSPQIPPLFSQWPTHYVLGNVDRDETGLANAIAEAGHHFHGRFGQLELAGRRIAFLHGDDLNRFEQERDSGNWDVLCYGHTHIAKQEQAGDTIVLNPGALYRATPHSIAALKLPELEVYSVEC